MLGRFCKIENNVLVPGSDKSLLLDNNGMITSRITGRTIEPKRTTNNEPYINLEVVDKIHCLKIAVLLACVTKKIKIPITAWWKLDVQFLDGDSGNILPENLIWKFPDSGIHPNPKSNFRYIPGFTRYSINESGEIYSHVSNHFLSPYSDEMGYLMFGLTPDIGKRTIVGMHRALALAFLPYPANVDSLDVNHLDGVKSNNSLVNLEWGTRKRNCDHAYSTGLRTDNINVDVRDSFTGDVMSFYSLEECARQLNMDGETIRVRIRSCGQTVYPPGFQFKESADNTPWRIMDDPEKELRRSGVPKPLLAVSIETGERHHLKSANELGKLLGISGSGASSRVRNLGSGLEINGYFVTHFTNRVIKKSH